MCFKVSTVCLFLLVTMTTISSAQNLDGSPYTPGKDADIDLFMNNWRDSEPRTTHGALVERDILTQGDPMNPPRKGAVLIYVKRFTYAELPPDTSTEPVTLDGEQEIFYILSGKGIIKEGRGKADLYSGIAVLMPEKRKFTIANTGNEPLTMYLIAEPVPEGFKPKKKMVVKNENTLPIVSTSGHWSHIVKNVFLKTDGCATLHALLTVAHDPMTIGHPHSHNEGCEEAWTAIKGTSIAFIGKQIRMQPPGTAYMIPPDGNTPHCNINTSDEMIKLLYFSVRKDIE